MANVQCPPENTGLSAAPLVPVILLILVGTMIAFSVSLSKLVADAGAPILWLVSVAQGGAGLIVLALAAAMGQVRGNVPQLAAYTLGAGFFLAAPTALSFLAVAHVGAGFLSLVYAFPVLVTYALAVGLGMERLQTGKIFGVTCGLAGGIVLALSKLDSAGTGGWVAAAALIPLIIALGNIYRTRFWPADAGAILLAGLTLTVASLMLGMLAMVREGAVIQLLWQRTDLTVLVLANMAVFAIQFIFYFLLQRIAGPTYLSQIGAVGAVLGVALAFVFLGERLPENFVPSMLLIVTGVALFQRSALRTRS